MFFGRRESKMQAEILTLIEEKQFTRLRHLLSNMNPADIAFILEDADKKDLPVVFRVLPKELAAEVFSYMETDMQQHLIESFSDTELRDVMDELFMDDAVDLIDEMPASVAKRILKQTDAQTRKMINKLLAYPDDSAGSIMTTEYIDLKKYMTVEEAFDRIRKLGVETESIYTCFVTGKSRKLLGVISVKDLLLNSKDCIIEDIMEENVISANTLDDKETVVNLFDKYDFYSVPIVDTECRLVGIVTVDDAIDVLQEEVSEDFDKIAAILPSEKSYLKTGIFDTFKSRIPWLLFLMISATFTGMIISSFEDKLARWIALIAFIPMLMGTGGNCGSQSSVTVIRALSLGDIEFNDIWRVIWKELRVAIVCGGVLAVVNFVKLYFIDFLLLNNFDEGVHIPEMAAVSITVFLVVIIAKLIGSTLPIIAKKLGLDPAVMASPLVTTILDAFSLIIYFATAIFLLTV